MSNYRMRLLYVVGIAFNLIALSVSVNAGETLFAVTFGVIVVYLGVRYWMIATGKH
ncbi:hypothetical protein [Salinadaptatus halalkaliphilus]|uniref:hypothetical protein n=1 Tax=Salinadaptatus halalkaliphilus TaxID=2419781 RepID=UPI001580E656|nr:hypothetical protein [Salinadaptatus halalkaliphilus]